VFVNLTPGAPVAAKVLQYLHTRGKTGSTQCANSPHSTVHTAQSTQHSPHNTVHTTQWLAYSCHSRRGSHGKLPLIGTDELAGRLEHEPQLVSVQGSGLLGSTRNVQQGHSTNTLCALEWVVATPQTLCAWRGARWGLALPPQDEQHPMERSLPGFQ
jgi:hypothetical protein